MSAQRERIASAVEGMPGAFTAEDLHREAARMCPGVGLATIYRALAAMQNAGTVAEVGSRNGSALLAACDRHDHHHHLVCTSCGSVTGVDCPLAESAVAAACGDSVVTGHEITLYGVCANCVRKRGGA